MALDNSPRIRQRAKLARSIASRQPFERVLIVTEGTRTEPYYFEEIRQSLRLSSANIEVMPSIYGTDPIQVVKFAEDRIVKNNAVDQVYCVFDRDEHQGFHNALAMAAARNGRFKNDEGVAIRFDTAQSIPCFEYWLLLHFEASFGFMEREEALSRLVVHFPAYAKGMGNVYKLTHERLADALTRATQGIYARQQDHSENPLTRVGVLVDYLLKIKG